MAYDTAGLGDTYGKDPKTLKWIAEEIEAKENGPFNAFLLVVKVDYFFENGLTDWLIVVTLRYDQRCTITKVHYTLVSYFIHMRLKVNGSFDVKKTEHSLNLSLNLFSSKSMDPLTLSLKRIK